MLIDLHLKDKQRNCAKFVSVGNNCSADKNVSLISKPDCFRNLPGDLSNCRIIDSVHNTSKTRISDTISKTRNSKLTTPISTDRMITDFELVKNCLVIIKNDYNELFLLREMNKLAAYP